MNTTNRTIRNSGVELLKILAIFLLVVNHVTNTLNWGDTHYLHNDFVLNTAIASTNPAYIILTAFRYLGPLGNTIFFTCTAWYLIKSNNFNKKKWFNMLIEVWFISISFLITIFVIRHGDISKDLVIKSLLPTTFENNWYITCYLIFYPIHPFLNIIISKVDKKGLFRITAAMTFLYFIIDIIHSGHFYSTNIVLWINIYFIIAYLQKYKMNFCNDIKKNIALFSFGLVCLIILGSTYNILGLINHSMSNSVLHWVKNNNPFILIIVIAVFNCFRQLNFTNSFINYISKLTLLIYIIHENIIIRSYYRPALWRFVYIKYGYEHLVSLVIALSIIIFLFSIILSAIYDKSLRVLVTICSNKLYDITRKYFLRIENRILRS